MLISDNYRDQMAQLHESREDYGKFSGIRWAMPTHLLLTQLAHAQNVRPVEISVLDYGCGKGELRLHLPHGVKCYDPGVAKYAVHPREDGYPRGVTAWPDGVPPYDIVVCTDVLEHVEQEATRDVLEDLRQLTDHFLLLNINLRPAAKTLPDGRNAHINLRTWPEWKRTLEVADLVPITDPVERFHKGELYDVTVICNPSGEHTEIGHEVMTHIKKDAVPT